ncbi:Cytochrome P450 2B19 [Mycena sanguinolenta]|uniref:Cytochrome P450 2B19 n=1 Tax=Mycena sanguinolenta TaxID=230812 RepID=A0A8H7DFX5_9AGAR|nr:Cytochrome P450 2B19 [Mycena sanguinolenta]
MAGVRAGETEPIQQFEALLNVNHLLDDEGKNWFHHMDRVSASMVLAAAFGLHCPTGQEPDLKEVIACTAEFVRLSAPSANIINVLPFLDTIPGPMPWRKCAQTHRKREDALYDRLITRAVSGEASGMNTWAAAFARADKPEGDQRRLMNMFTTAAIETACDRGFDAHLHSCLHTVSQMDSPMRRGRLMPLLEKTVYLRSKIVPAFLSDIVVTCTAETLRWRPAGRFGVPHQSTADDVVEYKGIEYFIPKGSILFAVSWAIEHDQEIFEHHDLFQPDRFLDDTNNLKAGYETTIFTVCPGMPFAERSLWIHIAMMLWTFNIGKSDEPDPNTGLPFRYDDGDSAFHGEFASGPLKFPAVFKPRSAHRAEVARQEWAVCEKDLNVLLPQYKEH